MACEQELCWYWNWTGHGCACEVMGIEPETAHGALGDMAPLRGDPDDHPCPACGDWPEGKCWTCRGDEL